MPQALVTFNRFWRSKHPFQVDVLRLAGLKEWPPDAACPCDGPGEPPCVANVPPMAEPDSATTAVDKPVLIPVVANDTDANGNLDPASVAIVDNPTHGTAVHNGSGAVTYMPNLGFSGSDSFTYTVKDTPQGAISNEARVTVTVTPNPVAEDDTFSTNENTPLTDKNVLANDSGANLTAVLNNGPSQAAPFALNADGTFSYTPNANFNGTDSFTYHANDGAADSNVATVTITVNPAPPPFSEIQTIFTDSCVRCHSSTNEQGGLNLTSGMSHTELLVDDSLLNGPCNRANITRRVSPKNTAESCLFLKVTGEPGVGLQMPPAGLLDDTKIGKIEAWINGGALP